MWGRINTLTIPVRRWYRLAMCYPFMMIVVLIFYFHMKVNGYKIFVSPKAAKLPWILSRWFRGICYTSRLFEMATEHYSNLSLENSIHLYLSLGKLISTSLKKRLVIYQGVPSNVPKYFWEYFKNFTSRFSRNATVNDKRFVVGNWIF